MKVAMLLLAAGRGTRLGAGVPKAFLPLDKAPLLLHGAARLRAALPSDWRSELIVVGPAAELQAHVAPHREQLARWFGQDLRVVAGGETRQRSMAEGLAATSEGADLVLVHDAARALLPIAATTRCLRRAAECGAAMLAIPAPDTLKRVHGGNVVETVDRTPIWYAQTPQVARRELFVHAVAHAAATGFVATDDMSLLENAGIPVAVEPGAASNLKITRPDDLPLALALLQLDPTLFPA